MQPRGAGDKGSGAKGGQVDLRKGASACSAWQTRDTRQINTRSERMASQSLAGIYDRGRSNRPILIRYGRECDALGEVACR